MSAHATSYAPAPVRVAPALSLLESEARSLLVRLGRVRPFALQQTMVPAAALPPASLSAIDRHLISGRRQVHKMVVRFIRWLRTPGGNSTSPETAQRRFSMLRLRFNATLAQLDIFASVLTQRSEQETGIWLAGLDVLAADGLMLPGNYYKMPGMICYLDRSHGAAIRRARTRLPGGGDNPVAIIRMPRERMIGSGIASSLIHEVGHQAAALLNLIESIRPLLRGLPRYFVFRLNMDDPHPLPWMRVRLSCAMGRELFPHPQWDVLENIWLSYYPPTDMEKTKRETIALLERTMPALATLIAHHRPKSLNGASLKEVLQTDQRQPVQLSALFQSWRAAPGRIYGASPTMVFAVIGQARAEKLVSPEAEGQIFSRMLKYWALRDTLDTAVHCARPALLRSAESSPIFETN